MSTSMGPRVNVIVVPGDDLTEQIKTEEVKKPTIGPGLRQDGDHIFATKAGILRLKKPSTFWIDCHQKRYVPAKGEKVLGVVTAKAGDVFRVDIGGSSPAILSYLAFEGATKRNRPNVQVGDVVYAKLLVANRDMEPELVCIYSSGKADDLGVIGPDGFMFTCSLGLVRRLMRSDCMMTKLLGESIRIPFEVALGMNGRILVRSKSVRDTIAIVNALSNSEFMTEAQMRTMTARLVNALEGF